MAPPSEPIIDIADFRSDTVTQPDAEMRQAMAQAEVGDDVFGEDPTIHAIEEEAAHFLGKESALFVPSGTMANVIAVHVHCRPGDELICEERSHVVLYEAGGLARFSGVLPRTLVSSTGFPTAAQVSGAVRADNPHHPRSRLLLLENSHNMSGGRVLDPAGMAELCAVAHERGLRVHVDGARLANAAVASGCAARELVVAVDSVSLCFSKGLGAPVGSVIAGKRDFIHDARRTRKALGGGMRQAGVIAAAARLALRDGPARLAVDHARARRVADALAGLPGFDLDPSLVQTNIVMVELPQREPREFIEYLDTLRIRAMVFGPHLVRLVFHRDLTDEHIDRFIAAANSFAKQ